MGKKKKATRKGGAVNKSQAIRDYDAQRSGATAGEVVAALAKKGIKVVPAQVYNVRAAEKKTKKKPGRKPGRRKKRARAASPASEGVDFGVLQAAASLVKQSGGVEEAQRALRTVDRVAKALE